jgi:hypothetical protein
MSINTYFLMKFFIFYLKRNFINMKTSTLHSFCALFFVAILLAIRAVSAQTPQWAWLASGGGSDLGLSYANSVAVDNQGNSYVAGSHGDVMAVQKFNASGTLMWTTKTTYNNLLNKCQNIALDASGNIYITGTFYDSCRFGNTVLVVNDNPYSEFAAFLAKLDNDGNFQWAIRGDRSTSGQCLAVLPSGDVAFAGGVAATSGTVSIGNLSANITTTGGRNYFLALVSPDGTPQWIKAMNAESVLGSGYGNPTLHSLKADASGNIYGTGFIVFGSISQTNLNFNGVTLTGLGLQTVVFKCNSSGQMQWVKHSTTSNSSKKVCGQGLGLDNSGNVYVGGWSEEAFSFDAVFTSNTELQPYVAKFNNNGDVQWIKNFGKTFDYDPYKHTVGLATAANGNCYVSGWLITYTSDPVDFGDGVVVSGIPVGGFKKNYVVKLNSSGQTQWAKVNMEMVQADEFKNIALDPAENAYVCGSWISGTGYDGLPAPSSPAGIFLAKLGNAALWVPGTGMPESVRLYPNPATDRVFWEMDGDENYDNIEIYDVYGRKLWSEKRVANQNQLEVKMFPAGTYILVFSQGNRPVGTSRLLILPH